MVNGRISTEMNMRAEMAIAITNAVGCLIYERVATIEVRGFDAVEELAKSSALDDLETSERFARREDSQIRYLRVRIPDIIPEGR